MTLEEIIDQQNKTMRQIDALRVACSLAKQLKRPMSAESYADDIRRAEKHLLMLSKEAEKIQKHMQVARAQQ